MTRLNQILALEKGAKSRAYSELTAAHRAVQTPALLAGLSRKYRPKDDDGEILPGESTPVQLKVTDVIEHVTGQLTRLFDLTATKDWANCVAKASVVVDDEALLTDVPVTYLLFLEKQLVDLLTFVSKLPVLDPAEVWGDPDGDGVSRSVTVETVKTRKVPKAFVKYEATPQHPAQVDVYNEDITVGWWDTFKLSGALRADRVNELTRRVLKLIEAVKVAREEANTTVVTDKALGEVVFGYIFG